MRTHTANELRDRADVLGSDGATVLATNVNAGVTDLTGKRLEQAQLGSAETSHLILFRTADITALSNSGFVRVNGVLYLVDYMTDPRLPRPGVWTEVYCHVQRTAS